jgi:cellulose synthase/poly-beta-1,6-N-acetylglucosamine synthase-like glycosyltransferase
MEINTLEIFLVIRYLFFAYAITTIGSYIVLAIISATETVAYMKKNSFVNYKEILSSTIAPSISIIAPAYNESLNIIENVRSLLSNHYVNYDVIIVNDGSKDDSLKKLIKAYDLVKVDYLINEQIPTKPLREGIFKSTNPAFEKLIVVDKENGGKADALNTGLNLSNNKYVACIDVDCLLLEEALQKMIKPFLEATDTKVIAAGGVIRIANSCIIKDGKLLDVNLPKKMLEKGQILEYIRAFLLGRMAWSKLNGLLVISGAFGMFDKKIAIEVGGYDTNTVGEDMEIIVRMRGFMEEQKEKYKVAYIPDPLCWTEAPDNYKIFISQRNRWTRGTIETLRKHRKIGFNPKYRSMGLLSYPYWLFFERLAPLIEVLGLLYFGILIALHEVRWDYTFAFIILAYLFTVLFSILAIVSEELTYHQYKKKGIGFNLLKIAFLEPFAVHPFIIYSAVMGNIDYYFNKKKKWGEMTRKGMSNTEKKES